MNIEPADLLARGDIAALAGVAKATINQWVRRYETFPKPFARTSGGYIYLRHEIEAWLNGTERASEPRPPYLVDPITGCWDWTGKRNWGGYGSVQKGDHHRGAHRVAFEQANGPIPDDHFVHHRCGNPACVNPDHLELMSPEQHTQHHREKRKRETMAKHARGAEIEEA